MIFSKRQYKIKDEDREFLDYLPPVSVFLGGIIFLVGTTLAILLYESPNGGYKILEQFFSELGIRNDYVEGSGQSAEQRYAPPHPDIFNVTLYAAGFLIVPFFFFSYRQMRNSNRVSNFMLIFATTGGVAAGPMMIGVGVFDLSSTGSALWQAHGFWVAGLYLSITFTSILWAIMLMTASDLPYKTSKFIFLDYLFIFILVGLVMINLVDNLGVLPVEDLPLLSDLGFPVETYQKFIAYTFFAYYGLVVGGRLTKTKYDNTPVAAGRRQRENKYYCTNCGSENPDSAPFCTDCGLRLIR